MAYSIDELSSILFKGNNEDSNNDSSTKIFYGTALADSLNGQVLVQLDDAIYSSAEADDDYEYLTLSEDINDVDSIDEDEDLQDVGEEEEIVFYQED